ncbi:hypothetical protein [Lacticaseibacillus paracasei]|uniref:hypothetical protein n=1 Tax=Lacticaseibacillus paracasei TaxID=1597 RepID=UPI001CDB6686|nr:hypothetical protein [Lacticaseibacillus paracasei]
MKIQFGEDIKVEQLSVIIGGKKGIDWGKVGAAGVGCGLITWWRLDPAQLQMARCVLLHNFLVKF